jgi:hypothetical protein
MHYNNTYCQIAADEIDGFGKKPMSDFLDTIRVN